MASGKLSPRQKMINMMYLVLTALLALNISKDILDALTKLNASLDQTVKTVGSKNADVYKAFVQAEIDNPEKAGPWKEKAFQVKDMSNELNQYIDTLKENLIQISGGYKKGSTTIPKSLDAREKPANFLLNEGEGEKLKQKIDAYRLAMLEYTTKPQIKSSINENFDTGDQPVGEDSTLAAWEKANFEHFPLAAILPFLTDYQAKIRNTESDIIGELKENIGAEDFNFSAIRVIVDDKSKYVTQGDEYEAKVFLAAYDETSEPEIIINGEALTSEDIVNGQGIVKFKADNVGEQKWGGKITIKQIGKPDKEFEIPEQIYTVAPPSVVISPTKMNVLYKGVQNPVEIGVPGVDPSKLRVSGIPLSGSNGNYMANVTNVTAKEISINVSVEETDEEGNTTTRSVGSKKFRIKGLPPATGSVFGKTQDLMSKSLLKRAKVDAKYQDFPFDLNLTVVSFEVAIPGFPPEAVRGNTMPSQVQTRLERLRPGQTVSIRNIKATGPGGIRVNSVSPISIDVN